MAGEVWCSCSSCARSGETIPDPVTQQPVAGQWLSHKVAAKHAKRDNFTSILTTTLQNLEGDEYGLPVRSRDVQLPTESSVDEADQFGPDDLAGDATDVVDEPPSTPPASPKSHPATARQISSIFSEIDRRTNDFFRHTDLEIQFDISPEYIGQPAPFPSFERCQHNAVFVSHYRWVQGKIRSVNALTAPDELKGQKDALIRKLHQERDTLDEFRSMSWTKVMHKTMSEGISKAHPHVTVSVNPPNYTTLPRHPFILVVLLVVTLLETIGSLSLPHCGILLSTIRLTLLGAFTFSNGLHAIGLTAEQQRILDDFPTDARTARQTFQLEPDYVPFVCCPACFSLYHPDSAPAYCTRKDIRKVCGERLFKPDDNLKVKPGPGDLDDKLPGPKARKVFGFQTIQSWLGRFLNRPDVETFLDSVWDQPASEGDMWSARAIREFKGPDGEPFSNRPPQTYHLLFSLFIDWFNPYGNKQAGQSYSTGVLYMICLNLPPHLRYRLENVYLVGVIPGPVEPSLHQINHILKPLVDTFLQFWYTGFSASRTYLHPEGMLLRGALIPLICDLPAARKAAGFLGHAANVFCSFCALNKDEIDNVYPDTWPQKHSYSDHMRYAILWRDARTQAARKAIEDTYGIRWSELLRLPYWNPLEYTILDAMHNLFLGEFQHHCRKIWNLNIKGTSIKKKELAPHSAEKQREEYGKIVKGITNGSESAISKPRKGYVVAVAAANGVKVPPGSYHRAYATALLKWYQTLEVKPEIVIPQITVVQNPETRQDQDQGTTTIEIEGETFEPSYGYVSKEVIETIQQDIAVTTLPSWIGRPPCNFGSPSHGKLKADHWRTICTVNLVITLTRLWGHLPDGNYERRMVNNFLDLVIAIEHASKRSMNETRISIYEKHMRRYLQTLPQLYAHHTPVPNHHLALHLPQCFRNFGPVHAWWSFPFERYNGVMQKLKKNQKPGQMELTFLRAFARGSNLRALLPHIKFPNTPEYTELIKRFMDTFLSRAQGTLISDILSFSSPQTQPNHVDGPSVKATLPNGSPLEMRHDKCMSLQLLIYDKLLHCVNMKYGDTFVHLDSMFEERLPLPLDAQPLRRICVRGVNYNTAQSSRAPGDSYVMFCIPGDNTPRAGRIQDIFLHRRRHGKEIVLEPFLWIQEFKPLTETDRTKDIFARILHLYTWLCYDEFLPDGHVISTDEIIGHFASYRYVPVGFQQKCIVVRSLDRT